MKRISKHLFLLSFTSLTTLAASTAFAQQTAYAPELEGGITASIGTFYAAPGSDNLPYAVSVEQDGSNFTNVYPATEYDWGFEASLGYVFDGTANGIELSYRGLNADSDNSIVNESGFISAPGFEVETNEAFNQLTTEFNSVDLMVSQFLDIGEAMQMRFSGGLAYIDIEQDNSTTFQEQGAEDLFATVQQTHSEYQGWGPRLGIDARYDFGQGFGIVGGGSAAYFIGELDSNASLVETETGLEPKTAYDIQDNTDNHAVLNLRGNLGIDYVYFFDNEESTLGIELGYMADYYNEAISQISTNEIDAELGAFDADSVAASFMGPYVNLKGVF